MAMLSHSETKKQMRLSAVRFNIKAHMPPTELEIQKEIQSGLFSFRFFYRPTGVYASVHTSRNVPNSIKNCLRLCVKNMPDGGQTFSKNGFATIRCDHSNPDQLWIDVIEPEQTLP